MIRHTTSILLLILILAGLFRFFGINWDQDQHLHPDERFLTMVTQAISWPSSVGEYINTDLSPANPNNVGFDFYVYGTLPLYLVKSMAQAIRLDDYTHITLIGRAISAAIDMGSVLLVFLIARRLGRSEKESVLASLVYACMGLPIQLSHFYATDPYLVFFLLSSVYFALTSRSSILAAPLSALFFACAVGSKISAVIFVPVVVLCFILTSQRKLSRLVVMAILFVAVAAIVLRFSQPYLFAGSSLIPTQINPKFIQAINQLQAFNTPDGWFPPSVQWINITHGIFPLQNMLLWGLGLPLGLISIASLLYVLTKLRKEPNTSIPLLTVLIVFGYQSTQFAQPLRYFYPLYPFLAIIVGMFIVYLKQRLPITIYFLLCTLLFIWPLALMSLYAQPHTRVTATKWALDNIPAGSSVSCEVWDDCVPLNGTPRYTFIEMPLYDAETPEKWIAINQKLQSLDYIVLSSNRLYGSIVSTPEKYPSTSKWYQDLFAGRLGFQKIAEFTSRPNLPIPGLHLCITPPNIKYGAVSYSTECPATGISFVDDYADETWTVYDHPKVTIFKKVSALPSQPQVLPR